MISRISSILMLGLVLLLAACGTIATPEWERPTAATSPFPPTPTAAPPIDPATAEVGRWQWTQFFASTETYPPVQLWVDVDDAGAVNGVLSIYPNYPDIPPAALTLIQQNGCNLAIESLRDAMIDGYFYTPREARVHVNVTECSVKYYGTVTLSEPLNGAFVIAYDDTLTQAILHPVEIELTPIERGQRVFAQYCSACHGADAEGAPGIPALNTDQVRGYSDEQVLTIISSGVINTVMPAWGNVLSDEDLDGVFQLVRNIEILEAGD